MTVINNAYHTLSINAHDLSDETCHTISMENNRGDSTMATDEAMADLYARQTDKQVYATDAYTSKKKLNAVTWCLGDTPNKSLVNDLLWADKRKGR